MDNCLNLCEFTIPNDYFDTFWTWFADNPANFKRIYIGSYACQNLFTQTDYLPFVKECEERNIPITLVIPVMKESRLGIAKIQIRQLVQNHCVDELSVNDVGMVRFANTLKNDGLISHIMMGRLFTKNIRDIRHGMFVNPEDPIVPDFQYKYAEENNIDGFETEILGGKLKIENPDNKYIVGLHSPITLHSITRRCRYAAMGHQEQYRFRPDAACERQCLWCSEKFELPEMYDENTHCSYYMLGRGLYTKFAKVGIEGTEGISRNIYNPYLETKFFKS